MSHGHAQRVHIHDNSIRGFVNEAIMASQNSVITGNKGWGRTRPNEQGNTFGVWLSNEPARSAPRGPGDRQQVFGVAHGGTLVVRTHARPQGEGAMAKNELDPTTQESLENARRNAGIPVTSGDLASVTTDTAKGEGVTDADTLQRGTTSTDTEPVLTSGDVESGDEDTGTGAYEDRTKAQLQATARKQGVSTSGSKDELIARLRGEDD